MTLDQIIALSVGRDMWSTAAVDGVPSVKMADGPMGIASGRVDERDVSVLTPSGVSLGASWDRDLVAKVAAIVGGEAKRLGVDLVLAPNLNLARTPMAGRAFELFGEDPLLVGILGAAWVGGLQSRHVGAVAKHLVCNDSETLRDRYDAIVDEASLREIYLLPFEMAARAGCAGLLAAYNQVNGTYCAEHPHLLTDIVRNDWKFGGFTVCDWFGSKSTAPAMTAGLDLEMPGPARFYGAKLEAAILDGTVSQDVAGAAATRVAAAATRWAGGDAGPAPGDRREILTEAAASGFVLLRNEGNFLPIAPGSIRRLAVIGPNAAVPCFQGGTFAKIALKPEAILPLDALRAVYGDRTEIVFAPGCDPAPRLPTMPVSPARDIGDGCAKGMTVDFFGDHEFGTPLFSETRDTNSLTWFSEMPGIGAFDRPAGIRAAGKFTAVVSGKHRFHIGGTGGVRLTIDGREVFAASRAIAPADIMGVLKSGESDSVEVSLDAGQTVLVAAELRYEPARAQGLWYGVRAPGDAETLLTEAEALAASADAVLLVVGETADAGVESRDRETTLLPPEQLLLVERICAANPSVAIIVNVAHAFDTGFAQAARALMVVWYPGEEFGPALADVATGLREPSGRLPISIARSEADYPVLDAVPDADGRLPYSEGRNIGYRGFVAANKSPEYAFGAGLGYGDLRFSALSGERTADGGATLTINASNHSDRASAAVIQVYRDDGGFALVGFAKQNVPARSSVGITIIVDPWALRRWEDDGWHAPTGPLRLQVGSSSIDLPLSIELAPTSAQNAA